MTHYIIHQIGNTLYSITKMDGDFNYLDQYRIRYNEYNKVCDCPAYRPNCKHFDYLRIWLKFSADERLLRHFNDKTNEWELPPKVFQIGEDDHAKYLLRSKLLRTR